MEGYKSFGITCRPRNGLNDVVCDALKAWCAKQQYCTLITEKTGSERHAHIQVWFEDKKMKGDVKRVFIRICERLIDDWDMAQKKFCVCVKICYNNWIENYCEDNDIKKDEFEILYDEKPLNDESFYPSQEEQDKVLEKANAVDKGYYELSLKFYEWFKGVDITIGIVAKFLAWAMYDEKIIRVRKDKRERVNLCTNLYLYVSGNSNACDFLSKKDEDLYIKELMSNIQVH